MSVKFVESSIVPDNPSTHQPSLFTRVSLHLAVDRGNPPCSTLLAAPIYIPTLSTVYSPTIQLGQRKFN